MKIYNHDLVGIVQRLDRFRFELWKSVSSGGSELNQFDKDRLYDYLSSLNRYLDWVVAQPQLDLPESHPREFEVPEAPADVIVESEVVNDILRIMSVTRTEIVDSQTARKAAGLISFDEIRLRALLTKLKNFLDGYVADATPLDLPESSPQAAMSGAGNKGA